MRVAVSVTGRLEVAAICVGHDGAAVPLVSGSFILCNVKALVGWLHRVGHLGSGPAEESADGDAELSLR